MQNESAKLLVSILATKWTKFDKYADFQQEDIDEAVEYIADQYVKRAKELEMPEHITGDLNFVISKGDSDIDLPVGTVNLRFQYFASLNADKLITLECDCEFITEEGNEVTEKTSIVEVGQSIVDGEVVPTNIYTMMKDCFSLDKLFFFLKLKKAEAEDETE